MIEIFKQLTTNQFEASLGTLGLCIERCPDNMCSYEYRLPGVDHRMLIAQRAVGTWVPQAPTIGAQPWIAALAPSAVKHSWADVC
jgi:hypothetical protein